VLHLIANEEPLDYEGKFYQVRNLKLSMRVEQHLMPKMFVAGASKACHQVALNHQLNLLEMAPPASEVDGKNELGLGRGIHFGIFARPTEEEAAAAMEEHFEFSKEKEMLMKFSMRNTNSVWKQKLLEKYKDVNLAASHYTLKPFANFLSDVPYLYGSYAQVATAIDSYLNNGYTNFVVELPATKANEFEHVRNAFKALEAKL